MELGKALHEATTSICFILAKDKCPKRQCHNSKEDIEQEKTAEAEEEGIMELLAKLVVQSL